MQDHRSQPPTLSEAQTCDHIWNHCVGIDVPAEDGMFLSGAFEECQKCGARGRLINRASADGVHWQDMPSRSQVASDDTNHAAGQSNTLMKACVRPTISTDQTFQIRVDDADPFVCPHDVLQGLLDDAPDQYSQGFLAGIYQFRQQLSILTARPF